MCEKRQGNITWLKEVNTSHVINRHTSKVSAVLIGAVEAETFSGGADGVTSKAGTDVAVDPEKCPVAWW